MNAVDPRTTPNEGERPMAELVAETPCGVQVLPPRPGKGHGALTRIGAAREQYSALVEGRPPRFVDVDPPIGSAPAVNTRYREWVRRADEWARSTGLLDLTPTTPTQEQ